jgi:chromosome segregation ATPase
MKYEKLIRMVAKKTVWPENKEQEFEAYDTKEADEAFEEIMAWYKDAETKAKALDNELFETKAELNAERITSTKTIDDLKAKNKELEDSNTSYYYKTENLTNEVNRLKTDYENAKNQLLVANSNFANLTDKLNKSYEFGQKQDNKIEMLTNSLEEAENKLAEKDTELYTTNKELELLKDKYNTLTRTLNQISELANFYNQWKKSNS